MTNEEAIEIIQTAKAESAFWEFNSEYENAFKKAIKALEMQIPKKPKYRFYCPFCSNCNSSISSVSDYCGKCGQKIGWKR